MMFIVFTASFLLSVILNPVFRKIGARYGFFDEPKGDILKIHRKPISYLGGVVMFLVFTASLLFFSYFRGFLEWKIGGIIFAGFFAFLLGFWDDFKWKHITRIKPGLKLVFLILVSFIAALILWASGISMEFIPVAGIAIFLTFFYILGLVNAIDFQDGLDGLAGGLVLISLIGFALISFIFEDSIALLLALVGIGSVLGFLIYNLPPAKIFMGDSGAYFLGFILAVLALFFSKPYDIQSILGPIFIVGLPVFETGFTIARRLLKKKSPFLGDREHFYDRVFRTTKSVWKTLFINYSIQAIFVIIGILFYIVL